MWYGMITCALPETLRLAVEIPSFSNMSISSSRTLGFTTQPLPITETHSGYMMPDGTWCRPYLRSPTTMVWPALLPP